MNADLAVVLGPGAAVLSAPRQGPEARAQNRLARLAGWTDSIENHGPGGPQSPVHRTGWLGWLAGWLGWAGWAGHSLIPPPIRIPK